MRDFYLVKNVLIYIPAVIIDFIVKTITSICYPAILIINTLFIYPFIRGKVRGDGLNGLRQYIKNWRDLEWMPVSYFMYKIWG